jgi:hypothetical protein
VIAEVALFELSRQIVPMEQAREAWQWSINKLRTDPLTFVLSVYVLGIFPAWITSCILAYEMNTDLNLFDATYNAMFDAVLWPLKVIGY